MVVDSAFVSPSSNESEINSILKGWDFAEIDRSWKYEFVDTCPMNCDWKFPLTT